MPINMMLDHLHGNTQNRPLNGFDIWCTRQRHMQEKKEKEDKNRAVNKLMKNFY